jgi:hypothetical protein
MFLARSARAEQRNNRGNQRQPGDQRDRDRDRQRRAQRAQHAQRGQQQRKKRDYDHPGRRGDYLADPRDRAGHRLLGVLTAAQPFPVTEHRAQRAEPAVPGSTASA